MKKHTIGIIIQARTGSTRLPQKVLKKIEGKTVLEHVIDRVKRIRNSDKVIVATTSKKEDDIIEKIGKENNILMYRGSEEDVLDRYYQAAKLSQIDVIARMTADCPLLDPLIAEEVIDFYLKNKFDYIGNSHPPTLPDGMDVEVFSFETLKQTWLQAHGSEEREHVTLYVRKHPELFKSKNFVHDADLSHLRLTLDEEDDFVLIREIYKNLYSQNPYFGLKEIIELFKQKPELPQMNQHVKANPVSR